jgi:hypothetical protein
VLVAAGPVDKGLGGKNDLPSFCFGFHQVAIIQAHLNAQADGDGYLALALNFYGGRHRGQPSKVQESSFLKRSLAAYEGTVKNSMKPRESDKTGRLAKRAPKAAYRLPPAKLRCNWMILCPLRNAQCVTHMLFIEVEIPKPTIATPAIALSAAGHGDPNLRRMYIEDLPHHMLVF